MLILFVGLSSYIKTYIIFCDNYYKVFRYSFWETIPMFFNLLKSDFILATKFLLVIDYELLFVKMQLFVKSISP